MKKRNAIKYYYRVDEGNVRVWNFWEKRDNSIRIMMV